MPDLKTYFISIIIPAYNEELHIEKLLKSIKSQDFNNYEIIVVDNNSSDNTSKIAEKYAKVVKETTKGVSIARNTGAKSAKGDILLFLDADGELCEGVLNRVNNAFLNREVVAATGKIIPLEKTGMLIKMFYKFNYVYLVKFSMLIKKPSFIGVNIAIRSDIFRKIGGFNEQFKNYDDCDLTIRASRFGKEVFDKKWVVKASARRITSMGFGKYLKFTTSNLISYYFLHKPKEYPQIKFNQ